jgi:pimeloyl-ACP methyl ester carboxylesterase
LMGPITWAIGDARRAKWGAGLSRAMGELDDDVVAERLRLIAGEDVSAALHALTIPVVLVHFKGDLVIDAAARAQLEAACNRPRVVKLDGPHFAIATRPAECAEAIAASLA